MHLYKTAKGIILANGKSFARIDLHWDDLINRDGLHAFLSTQIERADAMSQPDAEEEIHRHVLAPIGTQEVWAAGVTYLRSRDARMEESKDGGGADCYQKVYDAERPEIFFKALPHRVSGHRQSVCIRKDSTWNVPEPELTLYINSMGAIQAYTIGNDMSSRSIEGENPLYLPQAKVYERSAALGPCLYVPVEPIGGDTTIRMSIHRAGQLMFEGSTPVNRMKRSLAELASYLYRACIFPTGAFLMTGTCLVPPNDFTLQRDDEVTMEIDNIGILINTVSEI